MPRASVVITFHEEPGHLGRCLRALEGAGLDDVEVVLVDNGSRDARTPALLEAWADRATVLRNPVDAGPVAARNQGARAARAPVVVWLDPRVEVRPGWLAPLAEAAAAPGAGVGGPLLLGADGRVRSAGMALVGRGRVVHLHRGIPGDHPAARTRALRLVSPAVMAVAREVLLDAGGLDLALGHPVAGLDLCMRLWDAGRDNAVRADALAVLHGDDPAPDPADEQAFRHAVARGAAGPRRAAGRGRRHRPRLGGLHVGGSAVRRDARGRRGSRGRPLPRRRRPPPARAGAGGHPARPGRRRRVRRRDPGGPQPAPGRRARGRAVQRRGRPRGPGGARPRGHRLAGRAARAQRLRRGRPRDDPGRPPGRACRCWRS